MLTLKNPSVTSDWVIDLKEYPQIENDLPVNGLNVRNDSNIVAYVYLEGLKVGEVQRYSADTFQGRNFDDIRILNPDKQEFAANDLFLQITKGEIMGSQPFNPQWDMMFFDLDRYSTGCNARVSLCPTVSAAVIKYMANTHNNLIVQRRLDVFGSATHGSFIIDFGGCDILNSSVAKEATVTDLVQYRKTLSGGELDYTETNCEIIGWVIDYKINGDDQCTLNKISGKENATDDDPATNYEDSESHENGYAAGVYSWKEILKIDFGSVKTIRDIHTYLNTATSGAGAETGKTYIQTSENGTDWTTRISLTVGDSTNTTIYEHFTTEIQVRYIRCYIGITTSVNNWLCTNTTKIYDLTAIAV